MNTYTEADKIKNLLSQSKKIVIVQADNPDADSLGSALALEQILGDAGKDPYLYCGVDMPTYLRYLQGWDRVSKELPNEFDMSFIVDASTMTLLERLGLSGQQGWLAAKPCVVLDHHETVENLIPFSSVIINDFNRSSTGELIFLLAKQLNFSMNKSALGLLMNSILGDTQGLTNQLASADTYRIMAEMIEAGVNRSDLEEARREYSKMPPAIFKYKSQLISRTELSHEDKVALVVVPQTEINAYSPLYNPAPLIQGDMLQTVGVQVAIVLKKYDEGKVTGAIRCNSGAPVGAKLAEHFGGGGHKFASGFKIEKVDDFNSLKAECLKITGELLNDLNNERSIL